MTYPVLVRRIQEAAPAFDPLREHYSVRLLDMTKWMLQRNVARRATAGQIVDLLEMRAPPNLASSIVYPSQMTQPVQPPVVVPPTVPEEEAPSPTGQNQTLQRQNKLIQEAARFIQREFRTSVERRRLYNNISEEAPAQVKALRPMDRVGKSPSRPVLPAISPPVPATVPSVVPPALSSAVPPTVPPTVPSAGRETNVDRRVLSRDTVASMPMVRRSVKWR